MRETKVICDRCGDVVTEHASVLSIQALGELRPAFERVDLCSGCAARLLDWLRDRAACLQSTE